jgi:hypothetical protein
MCYWEGLADHFHQFKLKERRGENLQDSPDSLLITCSDIYHASYLPLTSTPHHQC